MCFYTLQTDSLEVFTFNILVKLWKVYWIIISAPPEKEKLDREVFKSPNTCNHTSKFINTREIPLKISLFIWNCQSCERFLQIVSSTWKLKFSWSIAIGEDKCFLVWTNPCLFERRVIRKKSPEQERYVWFTGFQMDLS